MILANATITITTPGTPEPHQATAMVQPLDPSAGAGNDGGNDRLAKIGVWLPLGTPITEQSAIEWNQKPWAVIASPRHWETGTGLDHLYVEAINWDG